MEQDLGTIIAAGGIAVTLLTTMVIGATELVRRLFKKDFEAAALIAVSALIGGLGGAILLPQIGLVLGIVVGLSGSGVITALQKNGTGANAQPTSLTK